MYKSILLAVDLNDETSWTKALPVAAGLCQGSGGNLHVITVVPGFGMSIVGSYFPENYEQEAIEKAMAQLKGFCDTNVPDGISVQHVVGNGNVYEAVLKTAVDVNADLIVMAAHRPELSDYLLGPNAARVVRHAKISVLVVR